MAAPKTKAMTPEQILQRKIEITTQLVDEIVKSGRSVTSDCFEWACRAYELRELGNEGLALYHRLSQMDGNAYSQYGTTANFRSACRRSSNGIQIRRTLKSFFFLCKKMGFEVPDEPEVTNNTSAVDHSFQLKPWNEHPDTIPSMYLDAYAAQESTFTRSLVGCGILTAEQVEDARRVFPIGGLIDGGTIFWYLNEQGEILDGKVIHYGDNCHRIHPTTDEERRTKRITWMSSKMKYQLRDHDGNPLLPESWEGGHGWWRMRPKGDEGMQETVVIVESEKTALILHELINNPAPNSSPPSRGSGEGGSHPISFLACGGISMLNEQSFLPLKGKDIIVLPDTDSNGDTFRKWKRICQRAEKLINQHITLSDILEKHTTEEEKERKIDVVDWILNEK